MSLVRSDEAVRIALLHLLTEIMRAIIADAGLRVHDPAGFVVDAEAMQAAVEFLAAAEALAEPTALRISAGTRPRSAARRYRRPFFVGELTNETTLTERVMA